MKQAATTLKAMAFCVCIFGGPMFSIAQSADCNTNPGPEIIPGSSCVPQAFNVANNANYWTSYNTPLGCGTNHGDEWMWFTAVATTTTINYTPNGFQDPVLTIFQGACNPAAAPVACADAWGSGWDEEITMSTTPGTVYHIRVQNYGTNVDMTGTICVVGTTGSGTSTASDCAQAINVCTNLSFEIDPNGHGALVEIPVSGSVGNPFNNNPGGSGNEGCLQDGEYNSTWMIVNVSTSGNLEFVFGGGGAQNGFYDWIMYPYSGPATCAAITSNTLAPVRCNWNAWLAGGTGIVNTVPGGGDPGNYEPPLAVTAGQRYIICFSNYSSSETAVPLDFYSGAGNAGVSCTPLGFSMQDISVTCTGSERLVNWNVPAVMKQKRYIIESSEDRVNWNTEAAFNNGPEKDGMIRFSYADEAAGENTVYYRIGEENMNGELFYSQELSSNCSSSNLFTLYPNPSEGTLYLKYESASEVEFKIYDIRGKEVYSEILERSMNMKTIQLKTTDIPDGMYTYQLISEEFLKNGSVVISK